MRIEFLLEERSAEEVLRVVVPKIIGPEHEVDFSAFRGKPDLLANLESRLRAYRHWLPTDGRIVVLIDRDRANCLVLKHQVDAIAARVGMATRVLSRIAVEELGAWYFGDVDAVVAAYKKVERHLRNKAPYRDPDTVPGGAAEALERVLQRAGYHRGGLQKIRAARDIAPSMDPARNRSRSFQVFRGGILRLVGRGPD
ncbi:MAG: DUF4276 family protein [Acidobacteria bacterium]|nr:DUF4276 family protein [Acidobacteriota bacterium]